MLELRVGALLVLSSYLFCGVVVLLSKFHISVFKCFGRDTRAVPYSFCNLLLFTWLAGAAAFGLQRVLFPSLETRIVLLVTLSAILAEILSIKSFRHVFFRIARGGLSAEHRLGDILLSDTLVSMASILVDIAYSAGLTYMLIPASDPVDRPNHIGFKTLLVACLPQGVRIKQCIVDYRRTHDKQHLLNLGKYIVANTPHAMRVQMAVLPSEEEKAAMAHRIFFAACVNAVCGFSWDVLVDWRLPRPAAARRFPQWWYVAAAGLDCVLRFSFLFAYNAEHIVFAMQILELLRRTMWAVFRVESEPVELSDAIEIRD